MDEQSSTESNNSQSSNENALKEKELLLKAREIYLKEQETKHKLKIEQRNIWLTSPVLIAIVSTIFGTALGAGFQGYANFQLERQKFEFSLIQKSLEVEEKWIEDQNDRQESAKKLLFLVNSGIIQSLNSDSIEKLARNPNDLPTFRPSEPIKTKFTCRIIKSVPNVVVTNDKYGYVSLIKITSDYFKIPPEKRCLDIASNFQKAYDNGSLKYFTSGKINGKPVICAVSSIASPCATENVLFDVKPSDNPEGVIKKLFNIRTGSDGEPLYN